MASDHYLPLFVGDFLASTATWTGPERGLYVQLLMLQWGAKSLPSDHKRLCRAVGYTASEFAELWPVMADKFVVDGDSMVNVRLEDHRNRSAAIQAARAEAGKAGAAAKWQKRGKGNAIANGEGGGKIMPSDPIQSDPNPNPNHALKSARASVPRETDWESHRQWVLDVLRSDYPSNLHTDGDWEMAARLVAGRITNGEVAREEIHALVLAFAAQQDAKGSRDTQYVENPARHFDGRGKWRGPFPLPAAQKSASRSSADRVTWRPEA